MKKQKKPIPPADAEPVIKKQPLLKRLLFGPERPDLSELEAGSTTILDILSPTAIDTKSRDYIVVDGVFHAYLYITGYGYSTTVGSCWLAPLVEAGEGVNISFSFTRQNREKILSKIAQTTMLNRSRMRDVGDTRQDYEELDSAITSGLYLKDVMNRQGEDFYYMHTLIEVVADDPDTLEQRVTAVEKLCVSVDMIARRCDYANEQGFLSTLPLVTLDGDIERKSRRNALTTGVAAAFPFVSYEHSDRNGIFLGLNLYNKSPVFLDPYDDYKYTNGNWWIGGNSGAGKSVTLQCLAGRLREQGKRVVCVIPKKGHEFRPNCEQLGGLYLRLSPSSRDCPNIMAIRRKTLDAYAGIQELAARDDSVLADKISRLIIWYSLQKKDLTEEDKNYLDASLVECYDRYGITFDNASVVDENGAFKEMPIIPDWYNVLLEKAETKHLAVVHLKNQPAYVIIDVVLELQYLEYWGSAFGMLQNQKVFILFVGIVFLAVLLFFLFKLPEQKKFRIVHVLLAVIIAGGIGNMIDRFRLDYVVDFISFVLINYPIFNVADIYVVVATIGLFILFLFVYKEKDLEFLNFKQNRYREMK